MRTAADRPPEAPEREVLAGAVERVTFHNPENGFCVLRTRARGRRDLVTVVGHAATVAPGERITATGEWVNDRTRGQQFRAGFIRTAEPTSLDGIGCTKASHTLQQFWVRAFRQCRTGAWTPRGYRSLITLGLMYESRASLPLKASTGPPLGHPRGNVREISQQRRR